MQRVLRKFLEISINFNSPRYFSSSKLSVGILGVPFDKGASKRGVNEGPKALRQAGLIDEIKSISKNVDVKDYGDVHYDLLLPTKSSFFSTSNNNNITDVRKTNGIKELRHVAACNEVLASKIEQIINDGRMPVALGGDHSMAIGSISGMLRKYSAEKFCVIWVDAHIDLNTSETSPSGNMHGMPVSLLVQELQHKWSNVSEFQWCQPKLELSNFCWIGLRSIDYYERIMMEEFGINYFDMRDIEKMGIEKVIHKALAILNPHNDKKIHLSFDIDALDPIHAKSTGTPVLGGLTLREGAFLVEEIAASGCLASMDLVEVNPTLGDEKEIETTLNSAILIIKSALGNNRSGNCH